MKVEVKYLLKGFSRNLGFYGKGTAYVHGTALVLAGDFSMFYRPFLLALFHEMVAVHTYRTIPYSKIVRYTPAKSPLRRYHKIIIERPGKKGIPVAFKIRDSSGSASAEFARELEDHIAAFASTHHGLVDRGGL